MLTFLPILLFREKQVTGCLVVSPGEKGKHWLRFKYPYILHCALQWGTFEVLICAM